MALGRDPTDSQGTSYLRSATNGVGGDIIFALSGFTSMSNPGSVPAKNTVQQTKIRQLQEQWQEYQDQMQQHHKSSIHRTRGQAHGEEKSSDN